MFDNGQPVASISVDVLHILSLHIYLSQSVFQNVSKCLVFQLTLYYIIYESMYTNVKFCYF